MKRILHFCLTALKWLVLAAAAVEVFCFLIVTASNYLLFGHARESTCVHYDHCALFLNDDGIRPTVHNPGPAGGPGSQTFWLFGGSTIRSDRDSANTTIPSYLAPPPQ